MPSITVKNIPDHAYEILKRFATSYHRSIKIEIICLIEQATISKQFHLEQHLVLAKRFRSLPENRHFFSNRVLLKKTQECT